MFRDGSKGINLCFFPKTKLGAKKFCYYYSQKRVFPRKQMSAFLKILSYRRAHFFRNLLLEAAYIFLLNTSTY